MMSQIILGLVCMRDQNSIGFQIHMSHPILPKLRRKASSYHQTQPLEKREKNDDVG